MSEHLRRRSCSSFITHNYLHDNKSRKGRPTCLKERTGAELRSWRESGEGPRRSQKVQTSALSRRLHIYMCQVKRNKANGQLLLSLTFNCGRPLTVVQYGQFSESCAGTHLPQQLPVLDDLQQTLCTEDNAANPPKTLSPVFSWTGRSSKGPIN